MAPKKPLAQTRKSSPRGNDPLLLHRIAALLNTVRCIAQHEDELCTLLHDAKKIGTVDPFLREELQTLLNTMPSHEYTHDLESLRSAATAAFTQATASKLPSPHNKKKPAKTAAKKPAATAKTARR